MSTIAVLVICGLDFSCAIKIQVIITYLLSVFFEYSVFGFCSDNYHVILSFSPITSVAGLKVNFQNSYFLCNRLFAVTIHKGRYVLYTLPSFTTLALYVCNHEDDRYLLTRQATEDFTVFSLTRVILKTRLSK